MCGRFSLSINEQQLILDRFGLKNINYDLNPRYNIAPTQDIAVILNSSKEILSTARWGLIPSWSKEEKTSFSMINARAESIDEKPAYKEPFQNKRCLIIADSFYEWKKVGDKRIPFRIMMKDNSLFAFAGIYDIWNNKLSSAIITTGSNKLMKPIHDRMPVILKKEDEKTWFETPDKSLLKPYESAEMKAYQISDKINNINNEYPKLARHVNPLKQNLRSFFS